MTTVRRAARLLAGAVAGALLAGAFDPWALPLLAPIGIAGLVLSVHGARLLMAALVGLCFGWGFFGSLLAWVWPSIGAGAWAALVGAQAGWLALFALALVAVRGLPAQPVWVASLWTAVEVARSTWPWGGLPWGRLGFTAPDAPWEYVVSWVGIAGTGWLVVLLGAASAHGGLAVLTRRDTHALIASRVMAPVVLAGAIVMIPPWVAPSAEEETAQIAVVQGGVPGDGTDLVRWHREVTESLVAETAALAARTREGEQARPHIVLWPENATAVDPSRDRRAGEAIRAAVQVAGTPVIAGSIHDGPTPDTAANRATAWSSDGPGQSYTKQHLVPFGEFVPWRPFTERLSARAADIPRDMIPGAAAEPMKVAGLDLATALCFDIAYPDPIRSQVAAGAGVVSVQTSNATFYGTTQLEQQWTISRARALETGRAVVVSSINGISGAIAPSGIVLTRLPPGRAVSLVASVPVTTSQTPATRVGPWPERLATGLAGLGLLLPAARRIRRERRASQQPRTSHHEME